MKKALLASSALLLTAGVAAAEVTLSGSARMGLEYFSPDVGDSSTTLDTRLRFNIDASKETDAGVKFGGRLRIQSDNGSAGANPNAGYVYAEADAFRVEVGNANGALDSAGLMYAAEVGTGYYGNSASYAYSSFYGYSSGPYSAAEANRMGIFTQYQTGGFVARLSWITPDQGDPAVPVDEEVAISLDYAAGPFAVSFGYAQDGAGIANNDVLFLGGQYTINDAYNIGLLYNDNGDNGSGIGENQVITLYGNATFGATTVQAYISSVSADIDPTEDMAYGLGANYDLGGATLGGAIEGDFDGNTLARIGVGFSF